MTPVAADAPNDGGAVPPTGVCTACSLLCDDVVPDGDLLRQACAAGQAAWEAARSAGDEGPRAWIDGRVASWSEALDHAAACLAAARRVLVTGLAHGSINTIAAACDLAEVLGAAIDPDEAETARVAGPVIARVGRVTADWEELRDRAALVVFWFCDPSATHPRFIERFVAPATAGGVRRTIAVGPAGVLPVSAAHAHVPLEATAAVTAARALHGLLAGPTTASCVPARLATLLDPVRQAIDSAACTGLVTRTVDDPVGLGPWSAAALVRSLALVRPVFEVPLDRGVGGGADSAGAAAVCTWRYGAAGAIGRADRCGAVFRPAEADAVRLVARGEVDAVVAAGGLSERLERVIAARRTGLTVVRLVAAAPAHTAPAQAHTGQASQEPRDRHRGGPVASGGGPAGPAGQASGRAGQASGLAGQASGLAGQASGRAGQASGLAGQASGRLARLAGQASAAFGQLSEPQHTGEIRLRVGSPLLAPRGTMLRGDGRWIEIPGGACVGMPEAAAAVLQSLTTRLDGADGARRRVTRVPAQ